MKLTRVDSPMQIKQVTTNETATKAKAVQAFMGNQAAPAPAAAEANPQAPIPVNPNQVAPEDVSAITPQVPEANIVASTDSVEETTTPQEAPKDRQEDRQKTETSNEFQVLARKERQLRAKFQQEQQALKAKEASFNTEKAALEARIKELEANSISKQRLKERTYEVLTDEGISYDELTQQAIDSQSRNPHYDSYISKLEAKIQALEDKTTQAEKSQAEAQSNQYKAAVKQIETDVITLVKTDPTFETIKATRSVRDVVELIEQTFKEEGRLLSVEEACQEVEDYLVDEATKLASLDKIKRRLAPKPAAQGQADKQTPKQPAQPQPMKTLTNATSSSRTLSAKERAILAFKGELK